MSKTLTKGNVIVEDIKVGDIHYEYDLGLVCKSEVVSEPRKNNAGQWEWKSKNLKTGVVFGYLVDPEFPAHYSVNLYDYEAYKEAKQI